MTDTLTIQAWIQAERDKKRTWADIAAEVGVARAALWGLLTGRKRPSFDVLQKLHRATKGSVDVRHLLDEDWPKATGEGGAP